MSFITSPSTPVSVIIVSPPSELKTMSVIFQTTPPSVRIHTLPKNSAFISYRVEDSLTLSAWMPDKFQTIKQETRYSSDDFYHDYCEECHRCCYQYLEQFSDEDGEVDWSEVPGGYEGHCNVYDDGYQGQSCPEGHQAGSQDIEFDVANMVFEIKLNHLGEPPRYNVQNDSAYLRAAQLVDGHIFNTPMRSASNVFGYDGHPEGICWGANERPDNLREIVTNYFLTPFNNDLTSLSTFQNNCGDLRYDVTTDRRTRNRNDLFLCYGEDVADAVLIVDAELDVNAFFTLLSAGFKSLPEAPHVMLVPVKEASIEKNGVNFQGYQTVPDAVSKNWFVTMDGLLVGQI